MSISISTTSPKAHATVDIVLVPNSEPPLSTTFPPYQPTHACCSEYEWHPFEPLTIGRILSSTFNYVKRLHRRPVYPGPSKEDSHSFSHQVCSHYVQPVMDVFDQLKFRHWPHIEVETDVLDVNAIVIRFSLSGAYRYRPNTSAWLVVLAPGSLDSTEWTSEEGPNSSATVPSILAALSTSLAVGQWVLVSDITTAVLLQLKEAIDGQSCPDRTPHDPKSSSKRWSYNYHVLYGPSFQSSDYAFRAGSIGPSLRISLTTLLMAAFLEFYLDLKVDETLPGQFLGALNDPTLERPSFDDCESMADFDRYALTQDRSLGKAFFAWKSEIAKKAHKLVAGDVLNVETSGFEKLPAPPSNPHPLIPLPFDCEEYLRSTLRSRPVDLIGSSRTFSLEITRILKTPELGGESIPVANVATVCECRLVTVNGIPVTSDSPKLCVKILDDRMLDIPGPPRPVHGPAEGGPSEDQFEDIYPANRSIREYFVMALTSEDLVWREDAAYRRLEHAQGSVVPYYYGCHEVTLPDGHRCYGLVMEFIDGEVILNANLPDLPENEQVYFIRGARHALRVLEYADISQWDWHEEQLMRRPNGSCVMIDFGSALQSNQAYDGAKAYDYDEVVEILCEVGLDEALIKANFAPKEIWDP